MTVQLGFTDGGGSISQVARGAATSVITVGAGGTLDVYFYTTNANYSSSSDVTWNNDAWPSNSDSAQIAINITAGNKNISAVAKLGRGNGATRYNGTDSGANSGAMTNTGQYFLQINYDMDKTSGLSCSNFFFVHLIFTNANTMSSQSVTMGLWSSGAVTSSSYIDFTPTAFPIDGGSCTVSSPTIIPTCWT